MITVENLERRLDAVAAETLRRKARQLDIAGTGAAECAAAMAKTRAQIRRWRERATGAALRSAVAAGRSSS
ncbi:hypothetical protein [Bosea sp. LjRoot237]|uniref:hypothetical protein n=1 Tax=Bosea sp. LjRoot237 TaxID=3342292 RepID=UPI003ED14398